MSSRRIHNVCEAYCKDGYLEKDLPRSHFCEIYVQCTKFARVTTVSQVLVFHFTAPFSGYLFRTWPNNYKGAFFAKILTSFKLLTIPAKKAPSQMFDWVGNRLLTKDLKY